MKRLFLGFAAVALLLVATETANAQFVRTGGYYSGYYPSSGIGVSNGTRIGNNGFVTVGYSYPSYRYATPVYYSAPVYSTPVYYTEPVYYGPPVYYQSGPSYRYYRGGRWGRGWGL